ncbi:phosphoglucomutase [Naegleria gruberi]|uniref:phosphoglucomutase (alpha-D-glucose-1,6-bisphosphate-dependent) n=1 Tax=Naegleria gruberi TaxID=5762 RepID=D2V2S1_NAEGR|nr:phosphoglucomutase [Naegleria gruberi]EFC48945.1 phosphoglucomutase [Naegleria gruberi]|eukprot:XP_002681689.1 phosphoglucomutase [Naegleria gruberi strain NEG-M]
MAPLTIRKQATQPIPGQKMGTSGLRVKVKLVENTPSFLENFSQSVFNIILSSEQGLIGKVNDQGCLQMVIGGDGRYYNKKAIQTILKILYANAVARNLKIHVRVGQDGVVSTPAVSCMIRKYKAELGGLILTASHNPGGPNNDWGIKYNAPNGGPAPEKITDIIYQQSTQITEYHTCDEFPEIDFSHISDVFSDEHLKVSVIDPVDDYYELLSTIFDMEKIKKLIQRDDFNLLFDAMHGVTGPYAKRILHEKLGADPQKNLINYVPSEDFGKGHPDPNLTYAEELVKKVLNDENSIIDLGAASDGDGDRNMILGKHFFVTPSDSVAIIADYAQRCIPYFQKSGISGLARSMPTSTALDRVAKALGVNIYEVPTGWKYFGNLFDAGKLSICGEESFGTGSDHIREKDGMWAVLSWLSIMAFENENTKTSVADIVKNHWKKYGRSYYTRYDYEEVSSEGANNMMSHIRDTYLFESLSVASCEEFSYTDPIDNSFTGKQGMIFKLVDQSRIVFRLSGTGSSGATVRVYMEKYNPDRLDGNPLEEVKPLAHVALTVSKLAEFTGRNEPTVIT